MLQNLPCSSEPMTLTAPFRKNPSCTLQVQQHRWTTTVRSWPRLIHDAGCEPVQRNTIYTEFEAYTPPPVQPLPSPADGVRLRNEDGRNMDLQRSGVWLSSIATHSIMHFRVAGTLLAAPPSWLTGHVLRRDCILAPIPAADYAKHQDELVLLPDIGIGSQGEVGAFCCLALFPSNP